MRGILKRNLAAKLGDEFEVEVVDHPLSDDYMSNEEAEEKNEYHLEKINQWLTELKVCLDLPVNFKPRI